jgi:CspA family cold shock protein
MHNEGISNDEPVVTKLKWFNNPKGFGFVCPENEDLDAFLHITTLQRAGVSSLGEGASLMCLIERGPKGAQVREVLELIDAGALPEAVTPPDAIVSSDADASIITMTGTVKWYKLDKGFGFVLPDDGLKDIFIHKTCLERHQIESLVEGQRLSMTIRNVSKGREVIDFKVI